MANTQAPSLTSEGKQKLTASRKIVGNLIASLPAIDFGTFVFNKEKEKDPKYQGLLSETQALWQKDKYDFYDTENDRIVTQEEYREGAADGENVVMRESSDWDKSLDQYTPAQYADKKYLDQNPDAKKVAIEKERAKIYENPNDDPYLQEAYRRARAQVDELLSLAKSGEHPLTSQITTIYEEDPEELYQETARQYLGEFAQTFPEKALSYSEYAVNNPDNYDLHLLNQVVRSEDQNLSEREMSSEYMEQESQPHDEVENGSTPSYGAVSDFSTGRGRGIGVPSFSFPGSKETPKPEKLEPREEEEGHNPKGNPEGEENDELGKKKTKKKTSKKSRLMNLLPSNRATDAINNARTAMNIARALGMGSIGWILIIIVIIILYLVIFGAGSTGGGDNGGSDANNSADKSGSQQSKYPPIAGFSRAIEGPENSENGKDITYTINYEYDNAVAKIPLEEISLIVNFSSNATFVSASGSHTPPVNGILEWSLSDRANTSPLTITLHPNAPNIFVNATLGQITSSGSSSGGNACTAPYEGTGYCSVDNLVGKFGGDRGTALVASMICQAESGSDPFSENLSCPPDYSIGLFQINQLAHCSQAFSSPTTCTIGNQSTLSACVNRFENPDENINYAYQLYTNGGTGWTTNKWSSYAMVKSKLSSCGIL